MYRIGASMNLLKKKKKGYFESVPNWTPCFRKIKKEHSHISTYYTYSETALIDETDQNKQQNFLSRIVSILQIYCSNQITDRGINKLIMKKNHQLIL